MKLAKKLFAVLTLGLFQIQQAMAGTVSVTDFRNTSGAGSKRLDDVLIRGEQTGQTILDFIFVGFTLLGVIVVGISLYALYQASKDDSREKPKSAIVGLFVGGALTIVGLVTGYMANTVS